MKKEKTSKNYFQLQEYIPTHTSYTLWICYAHLIHVRQNGWMKQHSSYFIRCYNNGTDISIKRINKQPLNAFCSKYRSSVSLQIHKKQISSASRRGSTSQSYTSHERARTHLDLASSTCKICMMNGNNRSYCVAIQFPFDEHFHILVVKWKKNSLAVYLCAREREWKSSQWLSHMTHLRKKPSIEILFKLKHFHSTQKPASHFQQLTTTIILFISPFQFV